MMPQREAIQTWIDKRTAATRLGRSWRRVLDLAKAGEFKSKRERDPVTNQQVVLIHSGSLERYIDSLKPSIDDDLHPPSAEALAEIPFTPTVEIDAQEGEAMKQLCAGVVPDNIAALSPIMRIEAFKLRKLATEIAADGEAEKKRAHLERLARPTVWLTLDECAEVTGLPASLVHSLIASGALPALDVGIRAGGKWRVKRTDLDAIQGSRLVAG